MQTTRGVYEVLYVSLFNSSCTKNLFLHSSLSTGARNELFCEGFHSKRHVFILKLNIIEPKKRLNSSWMI